jgi:hypothetical protein
MKALIHLFALAGIICPVVSGQTKSEVKLPDTEIFEIASAHTGREYSIFVAFPDGYQAQNGKEYPLLLCLDANAGFALITQIYRYLRFGNEVPEMLVVGIGYPTDSSSEIVANRISDMTPTSKPEQDAIDTESLGVEVRSGGAGEIFTIHSRRVIALPGGQLPDHCRSHLRRAFSWRPFCYLPAVSWGTNFWQVYHR